MNPRVNDILRFWFGPDDQPRQDRRVWYVADPAFDKMCAAEFLQDYHRGAAGQLDDWKSEPGGMLALILLLDQFPRNLPRQGPSVRYRHRGVCKRPRGDREAIRSRTRADRAQFYLHAFNARRDPRGSE